MTNTYTGVVRPGGAPDERHLTHARISKLSVSSMDNNCYLVTCSATGQQLLIDAADDAARLLTWQQSSGGTLTGVLTTHQHWDHTRALAEVLARTGVPALAGDLDAEALPVPVQRRLQHGDQVQVGQLSLEVIHLRGHTPGSVALLLDAGAEGRHLFTGDSLFPGGVGNTFGDRAAFEQLLQDVEDRIFAVLDDDTWVYPGHGGDTTLGAERPQLPAWRERGW